MPAAAAAFWAGLVAWSAVRPWLAPWMAIAIGLSALAGAWLAAPRRIAGRDALAGAGLVASEPAAVSAVAAGTRGPGRGAPAAAALGLAGVFALGCGWGGVQDARLDGQLLGRLAPERVTIEGSLRTDPSLGGYGWSATVDVTRVQSAGGAWTLRESVWVSGEGDVPRAVRGDGVLLEGTLRVPDDPGFAESLRHRGVVAELTLDTFRRTGGASNPFLRATQVFRSFVGRSIARLFPPKEAGLLLGLALGDDSQLDPGLARDFQATGLGHLLVVSGENVAMVLGPVLGLAMVLKLTRWPRFALGLGTVAFFVVLTGAEPSVMRAGVMASLTLTGVLMGRPRSTGSILAGAVLFLIVLDPWLVWAIGFQLSVTATAGMVAMATPLAQRLRFLPAPVALAAGTTLAAQLGVTPLLLFHFHEVPGVTIAANLAAFPAVSPALLLGIAASVLGLLLMPLGRFVAFLALVPMRYLELIADRLAKAPVAYVTSRGGPWVLVGGLAAFVRGRLVAARRPAAPALDGRGRPRAAAARRVVLGAVGRRARRPHRPLLRRRSGRLGARHVAERRDGTDRRRPRRGAGGDRARRARREAARRRRGEPPPRRPHHRAARRPGPDPGRSDPRPGMRTRSGCRPRSTTRSPTSTCPSSTRAPAPRTRSATCAWTSCRPIAAGPAPSPTRTTTPS